MGERFRLSKVGYVMLGVENVPRSVEFYEGKLGLKATVHGDALAFFDAGTISLVAIAGANRKAGDSEIVFTVEQVQRAYELLVALGVQFERPPHQVTDSAWAASFRDPDGHLLTLFGAK